MIYSMKEGSAFKPFTVCIELQAKSELEELLSILSKAPIINTPFENLFFALDARLKRYKEED